MKKNIVYMLVAVLLVFFIFKNAKTEPVTKNEFMLDTICYITIYDENVSAKKKDDVINETFEVCRRYEAKLSKTNPKSEIYAFNAGKDVSFSDETVSLLDAAAQYNALTGGAFDVTLGAVTELWDFKSRPPKLPDKNALAEGVLHSGADKLIKTADGYRKTDPETKLDLGGIAKGYISDKAVENLKARGVKNAIVNFGGNVITIGGVNGKEFTVGVQKPQIAKNGDARNEIAGYIKASDKAIVTSGNYQRYFEIDGKLYHHILDPKTGEPSESGLASVTVTASDGLTADALSTACFILGAEKGLKLIESVNGAEAVFITENTEIIKSSGMNFETSVEESN